MKVEITALQGKRKMSQNRDAGVRKSVCETLGASPGVIDRTVAVSMLQLQSRP